MRLMYTRFLTRNEVHEGMVAIDHEAVSEPLLRLVPDGTGYGVVDAALLREKHD